MKNYWTYMEISRENLFKLESKNLTNRDKKYLQGLKIERQNLKSLKRTSLAMQLCEEIQELLNEYESQKGEWEKIMKELRVKEAIILEVLKTKSEPVTVAEIAAYDITVFPSGAKSAQCFFTSPWNVLMNDGLVSKTVSENPVKGKAPIKKYSITAKGLTTLELYKLKAKEV